MMNKLRAVWADLNFAPTPRRAVKQEPGFWQQMAIDYRAQLEASNTRTADMAVRNFELSKLNVELSREVLRLSQLAKPEPVAHDHDDDVIAPTTRDADRIQMDEARAR